MNELNLDTNFSFDLDNSKPEDKKQKNKPSLWERVFKTRKLQKPNSVAVLYLRNNGIAETMEVEVKDGFFNIYGKTYHENRDCIYRMGKNKTSLAIIPEWSLVPIGTKKWYDKDMLEKFAELQDHTLKGIRNAELVRMYGEQKKPLNMKQVIVWGIIAIVALAIGFQYLPKGA